MNTDSPIKVELLSSSGGEKIAAIAAKLCYSYASIDDLAQAISAKEQTGFLEMIASAGHLSVFEHVVYTFGIEGVSRVLSHQLVRHRVASYAQKSQRYVKHEKGFAYITPPSIDRSPEAKAAYNEMMERIADEYDKLLKAGIPAEDVRYILPNAAETKLIMTMNARELLHFLKIRCCNRAQWEIRDMAEKILEILLKQAPSIFASAGPACVYGSCAEGKMTCGQADQVRKHYRNLAIKIKNNM